MKTTTCSAMGGPCEATLSGSTEKEMMNAGWAHIEAMHPEMAEKIKQMPKEETDKWMAEFHEKFEALPEEEAKSEAAPEEEEAAA